MTLARLLIGQILIVLGIIALGLWAATQRAAAMLAYQPALGRPWFGLLGLSICRPWALFSWWLLYHAYEPAVFAAASGFLGCGAAVAGFIWRARQSEAVATYGSARWASASEVRRAGLLGQTRLFLGSFNASDLWPDHVMAFAATAAAGECVAGAGSARASQERWPRDHTTFPRGRGSARQLIVRFGDGRQRDAAQCARRGATRCPLG